MSTKTLKRSFPLTLLSAKLRDYGLLVKFRLSFTVVFSSLIAYAIAVGNAIDLSSLLALFLGGFFITGASNAINQILEQDYDKLMKRTKDRPLAANRMKTPEAILAAGLMGTAGIILLWYYFNPIGALLGAISLFIYAFVYTPLKRISPVAVLVGAIPGAMPPLIGWICATGSFSYIAFVLFSIQFLWQFPHFWAIAWVAHEDYSKAGFKLLPTKEGRDKGTSLFSMVYILIMIPISLIPAKMGFIGWGAGTVILITGFLFFLQAVKLYRSCEVTDAKKLMFGSIAYLPIVLIALLAGSL